MEIHPIEHNGIAIAEVTTDTGRIATGADALDLLAALYEYEASCIILAETHLAPAFYDLRTGLAGEILQKFVNYNVRVAIVGDFAAYSSKSLQSFIVESNRGRRLFFCANRSEALDRLSA